MRRLAAVLVLILAAAMPALAADDSLGVEANQAYLAANAKKPGWFLKPSGCPILNCLQFKIIQNGFGKRPTPTDTVQVYYTGKLINGTVFDGTSPGLPFYVKVNSLIAGWTEALLAMREGDHWQVVIPPALGYGAAGAGDGAIPPNQVLVFDMRLVSTTPAPKPGDPGCQSDPDCVKAMKEAQDDASQGGQ